MRFHNSGGELDATVRPRTFAQELATGLSAFDCLLNGEKALYASAELTTGPRLYRLLREHGLRDAAELRRSLGEEEYHRRLWDLNFSEALAFARELRARHPTELVLSPAPYLIEGWTQPEYLTLWETVVRTRIKALYFSDGWEYSNGCAFEFSVAADAGIPTLDAAGRPLTRDEGVRRLEEAARALEAEGFDASGLLAARGRVAGRSAL